MSVFNTIEKQLGGFATRKARLEKAIAAKTAEERELADILQQEAAAIAAREAAAQELAECKQVVDELAPVVALLDKLHADQPAGLRYLTTLVAICERGYLGAPQPVGLSHAMALDAAAFAADLRGRLDRAIARLKELEG